MILALLLAATPAAAHHSLAGYDAGRSMELSGEIAEFSFTNPHPYIVLAAKDGARWRLEMDNLFELVDIGMSKTILKPGDKVTTRSWPDRNGAKTGYLRWLQRPSDGLIYEQIGMSPRINKVPKQP